MFETVFMESITERRMSMKFFNDERKLKQKFQEEIPISSTVESRIEETLSFLKTKEHSSAPGKKSFSVFLYRYRRRFIAAFCFLVIFGLGFSNPAVASKLPIIGSFFEQSKDLSQNRVIPYLQQKNWGYGTNFYQNQLDADDYVVIHQKLTPADPEAAQGIEFYLEELYCNGFDFVVTYRIIDKNNVFSSNAIAFTDKNGNYAMSINGFSLDVFPPYGNSYAFSDNTFFLERADEETFVGCTYYNLASSNNTALLNSLKNEKTFSFTLTISQLYNQEIKTGTTSDNKPYSYLIEDFTPSVYLENQWEYTYTGPINQESVQTYQLKDESDSFSLAQLVLTPCSTWFFFENAPSNPLPDRYTFTLFLYADQRDLSSFRHFASGSDLSYTMCTGAVPNDTQELTIELFAVEKSSASGESPESLKRFPVLQKQITPVSSL